VSAAKELPSTAHVPAARDDAGARARGQVQHDIDSTTAFLLTHFRSIAVAAVVCAVIGWFVTPYLPKTYRGEAILAVADQSGGGGLKGMLGQLGGLTNMAGLDTGSASDNMEAVSVATLKARSFLEGFIKDNNLLPILFDDRWDSARHDWIAGKKPPVLQDGYAKFIKGILSVIEDKPNGLVNVRIEWKDRLLAAEWCNKLVARLNEVARSREIDSSNRTIQYLTRELDNADSVAVRQTVYTLLESQVNRRAIATTRPDFAFSIIDPALPSEPNRYVRPIRMLIAGAGLFAGGLLAIFVALFRARRATHKA
jgi:uncharacterized protein involved in exopolysaccharide biosynthesis